MRGLSAAAILLAAVAFLGFLAVTEKYFIDPDCKSRVIYGTNFMESDSSETASEPPQTTTQNIVNETEVEQVRFLEMMKQRMDERKARINETCHKFDMQQNTSHMEPWMLVDTKYKAVDCAMGKTGTTRFKELFWQMKGHALKDFRVQKYVRTRMHEKERQDYILNPEYFKVVVVREPFQRMVSAYRQKLEAPNPEFPGLSKKIRATYSPVKDGKLASFSDFVNYLVTEAPKSIQTDNQHWDRYTHACTPCSVDYDLIAKQETIDEDARYFLHLIDAPKFIKHGPANRRRSDEDLSVKYYSNVKPRGKVLELYMLLLQDFIMFDYPPPAALKVLFGSGDQEWQ